MALFTAAVGVLTFALHAKLPYKKLLIITGVLLLAVLIVMVGEEINEMQLAGWIGTTSMGFSLPGWLGEWLSIFPNWETVIAQLLAMAIVIGSYLGAQYVRVWRPRQRGERAARMADAPSGRGRVAGRRSASEILHRRACQTRRARPLGAIGSAPDL